MRYLHSTKFFVILIIGLAAEEDYGPYTLRVNSFQYCKGPKKRDCAKTIIELNHDRTVLQVHVNVLEEIKVEEIRLIITKTGKKNSHPMVNLQLRKPCDQIMFSPLAKQFTDVRLCRFKKGSYNLTLDLIDTTERMWGSTFFYGNLTSKSMTFSDKCNFACHVFDISYTPTNKQTSSIIV